MTERDFLPVTSQEMARRGWERPDFVYITGDAYVDHPSFGAAIISRVLEHAGYRVAMLPQPYYQDSRDVSRFGRPRLGFLVTSGNVDSMVAHYTAAKKHRSDDAYTPGGRAGARPDRAVIVYTRLIKEAYPDLPVLIGGVEASLRRFAHYDYLSDEVKPSILAESGADLLLYGMGERQIVQVARAMEAGGLEAARQVRGVCYLQPFGEAAPEGVSCASYEKVKADKTAYARACRIQLEQQDPVTGRPVLQKHGGQLLVQNPPQKPLTRAELDAVWALPFTRAAHPSYDAAGGVKAIEEVEFSIMHNRGCIGNCNFCAIALHQGRQISSRSVESVVAEAEAMTRSPRFKGYIHDVGGPTANFRLPACPGQVTKGACRDKRCLAPTPCKNLVVDHREYLALLRRLRAVPGVKKVFIRSGLRYDYMLLDRDDTFFRELVEHHISGQLKVAPEHCSPNVLNRMGKPPISVFERFEKKFYQLTRALHKEQYLVPYLMSSHPGSTLADAVKLALFLKQRGLRPEQVQDFYPTPGTVSTCMFYTGLDPFTLEPVYVPRTPEEKAQQRALLQYFKPENRAMVRRALRAAGYAHLIGFGPDCLVPPEPRAKSQNAPGQQNTQGRPLRGTGASPQREGLPGRRGGGRQTPSPQAASRHGRGSSPRKRGRS